MQPFTERFLSPLLYGFRKSFGTQHSSLRLIETCNNGLNGGGIAGAVLINPSKAFDSTNHEILIAKSNAYGFIRSALRFVHIYFFGRKQRAKATGSFST